MPTQSPNTKHITVCPVCNASDWKNIYTIDTWTIDECRSCKFGRIDPLPQRDNRADFYTEDKIVTRNVKKKKRKWPNRMARHMKSFFNKASGHNKDDIFYKKLERYVPNGGKVLDLGCGSGGILLRARDKYDCHGVEISSYLVDLANQNEGMTVRLGDIQDIDFGDEQFDAITMVSIIEHLDDPIGTVKRCYELLKPGGALFVKTVNYTCWNHGIMREKWVGLRPPDHVVYFTPKNIKQALLNVGFKSVKNTYGYLSDNMYSDAFK